MDAIHGLQLAPDNAPIILNRPSPHSPIKSINAHQLAQLEHQYALADVDDSVLFPFLHGLEGQNHAQNSFFNHARRAGDGSKPKVPRYRGLIRVRVDEQGYELDTRGNVRSANRSVLDGYDEVDDTDSDSDDHHEGSEDGDLLMASPINTGDDAAHMHPVAQRKPNQLDTTVVLDHGIVVGSPATSSSSSGSISSAFFPSPAHSAISLSQTSPPTTPTIADSHASKLLERERERTPVPPTASRPRKPSHILTCSFHPDELLTQGLQGPQFLQPRIPDGISLRNFGIQVPIYATLADVVVYSPRGGRTKAAVALAERFKQAIELKAQERGFVIPANEADGTPAQMAPEGVVYNVYVLEDSFETMEKDFPHLVAIDSKGKLVQKIEFMEREKEEMRNLTRASEIADNVYLGNTGDVPLLSAPPTPHGHPASLPVYAGLDPFDGSNNPGGYDICIECHDAAGFPSFAQLRGVEERLRQLEDAWRVRYKEVAYFRDQEREMESKRRAEMKRKEALRRRREEEMDLDMDMEEQDEHGSDVKVLDGGAGLGLDMRPLSPPVDGGPLSPRSEDMLRDLTVSSSSGSSPSPPPSGQNGYLPDNVPLFPKSEATPIPVPPKHHHHHHTRSRSIGTYSSSPLSPRLSNTKARGQVSSSAIPPRPSPNASQVIHLAFPSSPPASPGTLTSLIPFLHFLHSLARPRPPLTEESANLGRTGSSPSISPGGSRARSPSLTTGSQASVRGHGRSGSLSGLSPRMRSQTMTGFAGLMGGSGGSPGRNGVGSKPAVNVPLSRPLRILLHAGDGYTETSVLALSYLMLVGNKTLPEAYLELQVQRSRSFFVYGGDVGVLRRVEQRLKLEREREREKMAASIAATVASTSASPSSPKEGSATVGRNAPPPSSSGKWRWGGLPTSWRSGSLSSAGVSLLNTAGMFSSGSLGATVSVANEDQRRSLFTPPAEEVDRQLTEQPAQMTAGNGSTSQPTTPSELMAPPPPPSHHQRVVPSQRPSSLSQSYAPGHQIQIRRARASTSPLLPSFIDHETWFNDSKFDGSFPSRVLPFVYLGNLAHAGNAYMLHALGITHVVSVGECALIPPPNDGYTTYGHNQSGSYQMTASTTGSPSGMRHTSRPGNGSLWVEEKEGRIKVLDIKGVCDDGIDSLRPQILPTVEWIDKARAEGGKVLVHCRVGVSRSATVVIAYVMHHLKCSLVDAYLMVRSRRLSVLIQPNMRLLYNLCGWEIELARRRAEAEHRELQYGEGRLLSWPFLAREVHILNERYLS